MTTNPTWYGDIRHMFTPNDIAHMQSQGIDLTDYNYVKTAAANIYGQVASGNMPPGTPWSDDWTQTFLTWMTNGCPKGVEPIAAKFAKLDVQAATASRIRKEISTLTPGEIQILKTAFIGVMNKPLDDPDGYFVQAGYHGLPNKYCMHHAPGYNPWHRALLISFENALRKIPGCENVTLPYWDISTPLPSVLSQSPFDSYTLPEDIGLGFNKGYKTNRYSVTQIQANFKNYDTLGCFALAASKTDWEDHHGYIDRRPNNTTIAGHDSGHVAIGESMGVQEVAAFDPVFWFYHCNLDRMFWEWQGTMKATDLNGLLSTITSVGSRNIFNVPVLRSLAPFTTNASKLDTVNTIDSITSLDVDYQRTAAPIQATMNVKTFGTASAADQFFIHTGLASVRVKGINRMKIPGSFKVHLSNDGKEIASKAFFQPVEADKCENCVENPMAHFDFVLPLEKVSGKLSVWVEPINHQLFGDHFPQKLMDNPTVNVRLLISHER